MHIICMMVAVRVAIWRRKVMAGCENTAKKTKSPKNDTNEHLHCRELARAPRLLVGQDRRYHREAALLWRLEMVSEDAPKAGEDRCVRAQRRLAVPCEDCEWDHRFSAIRHCELRSDKGKLIRWDAEFCACS